MEVNRRYRGRDWGFIGMNAVRINLIRPAEQRSASLVSLKSIGFIALIIVPLVLLLLLGWTYMRFTEARSELLLVEQEWEQTEHRQAAVLALQQQLQTVQNYENDLMGWGHSRIPWSEILPAIQKAVPATLQWRSWQMQKRIQRGAEAGLQRYYRVTLGGRSLGLEAESQVEVMRSAWETLAPMADWVEEAEVTVFEDDTTSGAAPEDRIFEIEVRFIPRNFNATADE